MLYSLFDYSIIWCVDSPRNQTKFFLEMLESYWV